MVRTLIPMRIAALALVLSGCALYSGGDDVEPTTAGPVAQCRDLVDLFCVAAEACGWDENAGPCREHYGAMCELNQTIVSESTMETARYRLREWECASNEEWITYPNEQGRHVLEAMLSW